LIENKIIKPKISILFKNKISENINFKQLKMKLFILKKLIKIILILV
jgi:hypothetical protein